MPIFTITQPKATPFPTKRMWDEKPAFLPESTAGETAPNPRTGFLGEGDMA